MALIGMRNVNWGFVEPPLLENITFQIEKGERVCIVGRNGHITGIGRVMLVVVELSGPPHGCQVTLEY